MGIVVRPLKNRVGVRGRETHMRSQSFSGITQRQSDALLKRKLKVRILLPEPNFSGYSSAWLERLLGVQEAAGSNPVILTILSQSKV